MASDNVLKANVNNFQEEVLNSSQPVVVDFWAQWCGPCRAIATTIDELADSYKGKVMIAKVNVDEEMELSSKYRIMSIPAVLIFKGGNVVEKIIGARSKEEYTTLINKYI